ncbi:MAG: hypothetical protein GC196_02440 [Hyphomonas sp.]|nr:hypothetical protein [Hyphomonas sp.]
MRSCYGRLLSLIVQTTRDVAAAETALAEASADALRVWPERGCRTIPKPGCGPPRGAAGHVRRHLRVCDAAAPALEQVYDAMQSRTTQDFPDERLNLIFVCAHPAIDETVRTPLMLQTTLGLDAARIARAKAKIRDPGGAL